MSFAVSSLLLLSLPAAQDQRPAPDSANSENVVHVPARQLHFAQVRIEQRVIIRVPRRRASQMAPMADITRSARPQNFRQRKIGKCLPMNNILGVQLSGEREIDLFTRDRKRIRARLEKSCQARSFYSGFYMERSSDGKICADRDILHSRTGTKCEVDRFRELVPEDE